VYASYVYSALCIGGGSYWAGWPAHFLLLMGRPFLLLAHSIQRSRNESLASVNTQNTNSDYPKTHHWQTENYKFFTASP